MILTRSILLVPLVLLFAVPLVYSQGIYKWVDDQGNTHFTTIYESVPPQYRNQIQKPGRVEETDQTQKAPKPKPKETDKPKRVEKADTIPEAPKPIKKVGKPERPKPMDRPQEPRARKRPEVQAPRSFSQPTERPRKSEKRWRPRFEIEGRYWIPELEGEIKYTEFDIGTDIDFKDDLALDDENYPEGRFTWRTGPNSWLRLAYTQVAYRGDERIKRTIEFGGETYLVGTRVKTDVDLRYLRLGWAWQFIDIADRTVQFGPLLDVKGFSIDTTLDAPDLSPPIKESVEALGALPTLGVALDVNPHRTVNIFAEISGLYAGKYGHAFDAEAGVRVFPIKNFSILGGWRLLEFKIEDDPDFVDLTLSGAFVGASFRF
jgi:hypothetical protein